MTLNVLDVAGNLQLTKGAIEQYRKDNPKAVAASPTRRRRRRS